MLSLCNCLHKSLFCRGSDPPSTPSVRPHQSARYCALCAPSAEVGCPRPRDAGTCPRRRSGPWKSELVELSLRVDLSLRAQIGLERCRGPLPRRFSGRSGSGGGPGHPRSPFEPLRAIRISRSFRRLGQDPIANSLPFNFLSLFAQNFQFFKKIRLTFIRRV